MPEALYFLALNYHDLGADDWAREELTLLAQKYPGSKYSREGASLLAKISGEKSTTLLAKQTEPAPASSAPATPPASDHPSLATGLIPSVTTDSFHLPSAAALGQSFVSCRLGAWC